MLFAFWLKYSYQFFSSWWFVKDDVALKLSLSLHSNPLLLSLQAGLSLPLALCSEHKTDIISLPSLAPSSTGSAGPVAIWYRLVWQPWSGGGGGVRVAVSPQLPFDTSSDISPKQSTFTVRPNVDLILFHNLILIEARPFTPPLWASVPVKKIDNMEIQAMQETNNPCFLNTKQMTLSRSHQKGLANSQNENIHFFQSRYSFDGLEGFNHLLSLF